MSEETVGFIAYLIVNLLIICLLCILGLAQTKVRADAVDKVVVISEKLIELEEKRQANERTPQRVPAPMLDAEATKD